MEVQWEIEKAQCPRTNAKRERLDLLEISKSGKPIQDGSSTVLFEDLGMGGRGGDFYCEGPLMEKAIWEGWDRGAP